MTRPRQLDPLLAPFAAADDAAAEVCLHELLTERVEPPARAYFYQKFGLGAAGSSDFARADADEAGGDVTVKVLGRLRAVRAAGQRAYISHFNGYVQRTIENTWHDWLNKRNPERAGLYQRIRYLLEHDRAFIVYEHWLCGLAGGDAGESEFTVAELAAQVTAHHPAFVRDKLPELVTEILLRAEGCVMLGALVGAAAQLLGYKNLAFVDITELESLGDNPAQTENDIFSRLTLREAWAGIKQLLPLERAALLLNLRDHKRGDALALFVFTNIATLPELAEATGLTPEHFAGIYTRLPLKDAEIAAILGVTKEQVSTLRLAARDHLRRQAERK